MGKTRSWTAGSVALVLLAGAACQSEEAPPTETSAGSQVTAIVVDQRADVGTFDGVPFERLIGHVEGRVHRSEAVAGVAELLGAAPFHTYRSQFEVIQPVSASDRHLMVVEVENRGSPIMLQLFNRFVIGFSGSPGKSVYPPGLGDGFLFAGRRSYARVQWENGVSPDVPPTAQGVGEVIVRDFGRVLRSGRVGASESPLGRYPTMVLTGNSATAWFINTFLAEGFNADPAGRRVYEGALVVTGAGNWLAINQLGDDGEAQQPYVRLNGRPLPASRILTRPDTDPFYVDVVSYTEFYRLRAALARDPDPPRRTRRYELPAPKVPPAVFGDTFVFETLGCNDRQAVPLNPLDHRPYLRALLVGLEGELGRSEQRLPPSMLFDLGPEPAPSPYFNDLPGAEVAVPALDGDGQPQGGVRFPEVDLPLGRPEPPAIPPVVTTANVCGNWGGYRPFPATELQRRYGGVVEYERRVEPLIDRLVQRGLLLRADRQWVVEDLRSRFAAAPSGQPKN
jgi:hypothetical protein